MTSLAYCPRCEQKVSAFTILSDAEVWRALTTGTEIKIMHTHPETGDHIWILNKYERDNLRAQLSGSHP
jgi:hypothetical protein